MLLLFVFSICLRISSCCFALFEVLYIWCKVCSITRPCAKFRDRDCLASKTRSPTTKDNFITGSFFIREFFNNLQVVTPYVASMNILRRQIKRIVQRWTSVIFIRKITKQIIRLRNQTKVRIINDRVTFSLNINL